MTLAHLTNPPDPDLAHSQTLQAQLRQIAPQLSIDHLQTLTDFAAYLLDQETTAATQELSHHPTPLTELQQDQAYKAHVETRLLEALDSPASPLTQDDWKTVRAAVRQNH